LIYRRFDLAGRRSVEHKVASPKRGHLVRNSSL